MSPNSKVLVVGGTGYLGKRLVKASLAQGHPTYVLMRPEIGQDIDKLQMLMSFKELGAHLIEASFSDHRSLVDAVKQADVVISAISGSSSRNHSSLIYQLNLIDAIKEAGNVKRFLPSEFGMDPARMGHALEPGRVTFDEKMTVRKAIEGATIPFTYVSANCFAGFFVGNLSQMSGFTPPKEKVTLYGDGKVKAIFLDEDDIAAYTIKTIDDLRTLNKTVYLRPSENILTQRQLVGIWEKLIGKQLEKSTISSEDFLASMKDMDYAAQVVVGHLYHIFYEGCLANFEIGEGGEDASQLYPEVNYTRMDEYLNRFL
ncbi:isoflavone reductase homolog [Macadamia integrifolia]|uniref:isoflavone reductase homolog n=1 Tax=Macadamia integrifolia TaxID=60698 RepID=UPI001C4E7FF7|nr:isoflavone reductase homolog [Macadamia integrifolia]